MAATRNCQLWIGPSGWSYDDWNGIVYPARRPRGFRPLAHIARYFNAVEVNSSFYRIPTAHMTAGWPDQVPADFRFAFKLTQSFTHQRSAFPDASEIRAFHVGVEPIRDAGLLGPLLIQFPWSFRYSPEAADWLGRLADAFPDSDRFVEVRHSSWNAPAAWEVLARAGGVCSIDQPQLRDCLAPTERVAGRGTYVRLHGRNAQSWFAENRPSFERYNYLYSETELQEWVTRLNALCEEAEYAYVFANNHYKGQGPVNALELQAMLTSERVSVPETLLDAYPRLNRIARPPEQPTLF